MATSTLSQTAADSIVRAPQSHSWSHRTTPHLVARDVTIQPIVGLGGMYVMTNCYLAGPPENWIMVDTGVPETHETTLETARRVYGDRPPQAIVLTHAHFDHYGSAAALSDVWNVPIYISQLDLPYVTGQDQLPPYDPTVGGFVSQLSRSFPRSGTNLGDRVRALPEDGRIPGIDDWRWIPTPGHTPGHVSLFRESDRTLLAGDAIITVDQDSALQSLLVRRSLQGPSTFATYDWPAAEASVRKLAELRPNTICAGHGEPISSSVVPHMLAALADRFQQRAVPRHGRYVGNPIKFDEHGIRYVPKPPLDTVAIAAGVIGGLTAAAILAAAVNRSRRRR